MYNDIIIIILCIFAVYGAYALLREIFVLFSRKYRVAAAVRIDEIQSEFLDNLTAAELYISSYSFLERAPVLLCEKEVPEGLNRYGYDIYIKQTEEK